MNNFRPGRVTISEGKIVPCSHKLWQQMAGLAQLLNVKEIRAAPSYFEQTSGTAPSDGRASERTRAPIIARWQKRGLWSRSIARPHSARDSATLLYLPWLSAIGYEWIEFYIFVDTCGQVGVRMVHHAERVWVKAKEFLRCQWLLLLFVYANTSAGKHSIQLMCCVSVCVCARLRLSYCSTYPFI